MLGLNLASGVADRLSRRSPPPLLAATAQRDRGRCWQPQ